MNFRFGHDSVLTGPDTAIAIGGFGEGCGRHERLGGAVRVNLTSGLVEELELHDSHQLLGRRIHHKLILLEDGQILVMGGRGSPAQAFWQMLLLNTATNTIESFNTTGPEPGPRWRHTATLVTIQGCQNVVVLGGKTSSDVLGDCFIMGVPSSNWTQMPSCLPRHSHSASSWGSKVIVSGGLSSLGRALDYVQCLDIDRACWEELPVAGLLPRYSHTSHIWNDSLFLVGGVHTLPTGPPGIAIISLSSYIYREVSLPGSCLGAPILLFKHSSVLLPDGQIIILGGGGNCFSFGTHLNGSVCSVWKSADADVI